MKKIRITVLLMTVFLILSLTGCGDGILGTLEDGAERYAQNSEGENLQSSNILETLNYLLDHYTSGTAEGKVKELSQDEWDEQVGDQDDPSNEEEGATEEDPGAGDEIRDNYAETYEELYELVHQELIDTSERFSVVVPAEKGQEIQDLINSEDMFNDIYVTDMQGFIAWDMAYTRVIQRADEWEFEFQIEYCLDVERIRMMKEEQSRMLNQVYEELGLADMEREEDVVSAVNQYLCETVEYPASEPYSAESHTIYGALVEKSAVCEGYAKTAQALFEMRGLNAIYVTGTCNNGVGHGWNLVQISGEWYQLDITWNDGAGEPYDEYYLVTDEFMRQSRVWDYEEFPSTAGAAY